MCCKRPGYRYPPCRPLRRRPRQSGTRRPPRRPLSLCWVKRTLPFVKVAYVGDVGEERENTSMTIWPGSMPAAWHSAVASPGCSTTPWLRSMSAMSAAGPVGCRPSPLPSRYHSRYCPASRDPTELRGRCIPIVSLRMAVRDGLQIGDGQCALVNSVPRVRQPIDVGRVHAPVPVQAPHPIVHVIHAQQQDISGQERGPLRGVLLRVHPATWFLSVRRSPIDAAVSRRRECFQRGPLRGRQVSSGARTHATAGAVSWERSRSLPERYRHVP